MIENLALCLSGLQSGRRCAIVTSLLQSDWGAVAQATAPLGFREKRLSALNKRRLPNAGIRLIYMLSHCSLGNRFTQKPETPKSLAFCVSRLSVGRSSPTFQRHQKASRPCAPHRTAMTVRDRKMLSRNGFSRQRVAGRCNATLTPWSIVEDKTLGVASHSKKALPDTQPV